MVRWMVDPLVSSLTHMLHLDPSWLWLGLCFPSCANLNPGWPRHILQRKKGLHTPNRTEARIIDTDEPFWVVLPFRMKARKLPWQNSGSLNIPWRKNWCILPPHVFCVWKPKEILYQKGGILEGLSWSPTFTIAYRDGYPLLDSRRPQ